MALDKSVIGESGVETGDELRPGTWLFHKQYKVTRLLGSGGFGITYLAQDNLGRDVVIKECFVGAFCRRTRTRVQARSESSREHLGKVMRGFLKEAQTLASLRHPNIVHVQQAFEDNDTAYMVLDYIKGQDMLELIDDDQTQLSPARIVVIARKLIAALGHIHDRKLLHCDVSPDNICLTQDGEPVLIDFGAARKAAADGDSAYTGFSLVKDGYSPYELYSTNGSLGPWSDLYALAATLYHAISGKAPADCQSRLSAIVERRPDPVAPLAGRFHGYPSGFLETVDKAMTVKPTLRYQSAQEWEAALAAPSVTPVRPLRDRNIVLLRRIPAMAEAQTVARQN